jgi:hypothetical protein
MQQQYTQGQAVWVNVGAEGGRPQWRPAVIARVLDDGRYRVFKLSELAGSEEDIVGSDHLRARGENEQAPTEM